MSLEEVKTVCWNHRGFSSTLTASYRKSGFFFLGNSLVPKSTGKKSIYMEDFLLKESLQDAYVCKPRDLK